MLLVYVAGKYTGDVDANIGAASNIAGELWEMGHAAICPHNNTAHFEKQFNVPWEQYINGDMEIISRCDAVVMVPGWKGSNGACLEHEYARQMKIPIYYYPNLPPI